MVIVVMGVSGSGKTTVGRQLANELNWIFADADDFHSAANRAKMAAGQPLNDQDRAPWLATLHAQITTWIGEHRNAVLACSALKETYRHVLAGDHSDVRFVYLHGEKSLLLERLTRRSNHYMPPTLLDSQLSTLEPPPDALKLNVVATPEDLVRQIRHAFKI